MAIIYFISFTRTIIIRKNKSSSIRNSYYYNSNFIPYNFESINIEKLLIYAKYFF